MVEGTGGGSLKRDLQDISTLPQPLGSQMNRFLGSQMTELPAKFRVTDESLFGSQMTGEPPQG